MKNITPFSTRAQLFDFISISILFIYLLLQFWFKYNLHTSTTSAHHKLDPTGIQTYDLQIIDSTFHVLEMIVLTTVPLGTSPSPVLTSNLMQLCV